jgi:hypothetical protein
MKVGTLRPSASSAQALPTLFGEMPTVISMRLFSHFPLKRPMEYAVWHFEDRRAWQRKTPALPIISSAKLRVLRASAVKTF